MPDGSGMIYLDLRRLHNIAALANTKNKKAFVVTQRMLDMKPAATINEHFDTLNEARRDWREKMARLVDKGMVKMDFHISGFHEED
jgi:hypothetical protein